MNSIHYRQILVDAYKSQELTAEDLENTLRHYAKLHHKEIKSKVCHSCGCPEPERRLDSFWCKVCHNEMNV